MRGTVPQFYQLYQLAPIRQSASTQHRRNHTIAVSTVEDFGESVPLQPSPFSYYETVPSENGGDLWDLIGL